MFCTRRIICIALVLLCLPLFGCDVVAVETAATAAPTGVETVEQRLEGYVKTLCSEEFGGRLPGTAGNDLAVEWLSERLDEMDIEPYQNDDYRVGFMVDTYDNALCEITVNEVGGNSRQLVQGRDFFFSLTRSLDVEITKDEFGMLAADEQSDEAIREYRNANADINFIFREREAFTCGSYPKQTHGDRKPLWIDVSCEAFAYLKKANIESIQIVNVMNITNQEIYNVVGRIAGTQPGKGVVLTAHFDHMGTYGETYFPGALDNASGTVTLLRVAELLRETSNKKPFDFDIIIALCNDEEQHMIGSAALAPVLYEKYDSLTEINIDCIGFAGADNVYPLGGGNCQPLSDDLIAVMDKHGIMHSSENMVMADHASFMRYSIPSVSLLVDEYTSYAHENTDTYDTLDYTHIAKVSEMVAEFVTDYGAKDYWQKPKASAEQAAPSLPMPDDVQKKLNGFFEQLMNGEEVYFDEELISNMLGGEQYIFTYDEIVSRDENNAILKDFNEYHLRLATNKHGTDKLEYLTYMKDRPSPYAEPETILVFPLNDFASFPSTFEITPIEGMESYYSILFSPSNTYYGFAWEKDGAIYATLIVSTKPYNLHVSFGSFSEMQSLNELKEKMAQVDIAAFAELWEEYSAKAK